MYPANYHNKELSRIFHQMADCYRYLRPEEKFRAQAYETASQTLSNMKESVEVLAAEPKNLEELKGIGKSIAGKIIEYLNTGKITRFEELKKQVPFALLELMEINGIGPATIRLLHTKLNISSREELIKLLQEGKLKTIPGLGEKKIDNLKKALKLPATKQRLPLKTAEAIGQSLLQEIKKIPHVQQAVLAGSLRRKKETVGDIDLVITAPHQHHKKIIQQITQLPQVAKVLAAGHTKASLILKKPSIQVDIRLVNEEDFGAALLYFTGSKEHTVQLRTLAKHKGWRMNEYGIFDEKTGRRLAGNTEPEIYALLGFRFIPPQDRLGKDELSSAALR